MKNVMSLMIILGALTLTGGAVNAAGSGYDCEVRKSSRGSSANGQLVFKKFVPYTTEDFALEVVAQDAANVVEIRANSRLNVLQIISSEAKTKIMQAFVETDLNTKQVGIFDVANDQQILCKKVGVSSGLVVPLQPRYHSSAGEGGSGPSHPGSGGIGCFFISCAY